ncbi:MAG TPA: PAS domain-containing protein [Caulobacteraceae bacterium]
MGELGLSVTAARAHQQVFAYWASLRRDGRLPGRADIRPHDLKRLLPTVSLIDVARDPLDYRMRLAGTGLYTVYGHEITGRTLRDIYSRDAAGYWRGELDKVVLGRRPNVGCHNMAWKGEAHVSLLWIRLPLSSDGETVDMILGYDSLIGARSEISGIRAA